MKKYNNKCVVCSGLYNYDEVRIYVLSKNYIVCTQCDLNVEPKNQEIFMIWLEKNNNE